MKKRNEHEFLLGVMIGIILVLLFIIVNLDKARAEPVDTGGAVTIVHDDKEETPTEITNRYLVDSFIESEDQKERDIHKENEEIMLLAKLIHAEAGNQEITGKRYVADVVLNRVDHEDFPGSIEAVIYQGGQFSVVSNGSFKRAVPDETDILAAQTEYYHRMNDDVLYFTSTGYHPCGAAAFQCQDHYFSVEK